MLPPAKVGPELANIEIHPNEVVPELADKPQVNRETRRPSHHRLLGSWYLLRIAVGA
jgi:hypothetical protein